MKLYLLAAILFAAALYLWFTPPSVEPMQLRAAKEVTVEEYQRGDARGWPRPSASGISGSGSFKTWLMRA